MFTWRDLARIGRKVFSRGPVDGAELQDYLYVLLYLTTASRGIFRGYGFEPGEKAMGASYLILVEAMSGLARATQMFPQAARKRILDLLRNILDPGAGEIRILPGKGPKSGKKSGGEG